MTVRTRIHASVSSSLPLPLPLAVPVPVAIRSVRSLVCLSIHPHAMAVGVETREHFNRLVCVCLFVCLLVCLSGYLAIYLGTRVHLICMSVHLNTDCLVIQTYRVPPNPPRITPSAPEATTTLPCCSLYIIRIPAKSLQLRTSGGIPSFRGNLTLIHCANNTAVCNEN